MNRRVNPVPINIWDMDVLSRNNIGVADNLTHYRIVTNMYDDFNTIKENNKIPIPIHGEYILIFQLRTASWNKKWLGISEVNTEFLILNTEFLTGKF